MKQLLGIENMIGLIYDNLIARRRRMLALWVEFHFEGIKRGAERAHAGILILISSQSLLIGVWAAGSAPVTSSAPDPRKIRVI